MPFFHLVATVLHRFDIKGYQERRDKAVVDQAQVELHGAKINGPQQSRVEGEMHKTTLGPINTAVLILILYYMYIHWIEYLVLSIL